MEQKALYEEFPFLRDVGRERQEQFEEYFKSAPRWLMGALHKEELKKGTVFIREGEQADTIFFLVKGIVGATDYRIYGTPYDFMQYDKAYAFGGMEFIMDYDLYRTTLRAMTNCTVVKISRVMFEKWMYSDIRAMKYEAKQVGECLLEEGRNSRLFLFMQGADRLALLLVERYEKYQKNGCLHMKGSQRDLADVTGLCVKSIGRGIKKIMEDGLLTKEGKQIVINRQQYEGLKRMVSEKVDLE